MRFLLWTALLLAFVASLAFVGVVGIYASYAKDLPDYTQLDRRRVFQTARILDRNGQLLGEFNDPEGGRRTLIPIDRIPKALRDATVAAEDANFYQHPGFDVVAILRALYQNVRGREIVSGASTITQQLVKNTLLTPEQTPDRKIKEAILAWEVSRRYSKDRILELYLNEVYYGNLAYGVEAAAQTYFGRSASDLDLAELTFIAGLPQAPSAYDPYVNPQAARGRQDYVLEQMVRHGMVTREQADAARAKPIALRPKQESGPVQAPHFVNFVRQLLGAQLLVGHAVPRGAPDPDHARPPAPAAGREGRARPGRRATPAQRQQRRRRGDPAEQRRDPGDGRQRRLQRRVDRRPGERRAGRSAARLGPQAVHLPDGVPARLGTLHDGDGRPDDVRRHLHAAQLRPEVPGPGQRPAGARRLAQHPGRQGARIRRHGRDAPDRPPDGHQRPARPGPLRPLGDARRRRGDAARPDLRLHAVRQQRPPERAAAVTVRPHTVLAPVRAGRDPRDPARRRRPALPAAAGRAEADRRSGPGLPDHRHPERRRGPRRDVRAEQPAQALAAGGGEDRHHRQLPRLLGDRLHAGPGGRRLGRQQRRQPDARHPERGRGRADLAQLHGSGPRGRAGPAVPPPGRRHHPRGLQAFRPAPHPRLPGEDPGDLHARHHPERSRTTCTVASRSAR